MMIKILTIGKIKDRNIKALFEEFLRRLNRFYTILLVEFKDENGILKLIEKEDSYIVICDSEGSQLSSMDFSNFIKDKINNKNLIFVIGDENGLGNEIKLKANFKLSFGKMTFLHDMFKLILIEQIYRAFTIIKGMRYHK